MRWFKWAPPFVAGALAQTGVLALACLATPTAAASDAATLRGLSDADHEAPVTCTESAGQCFVLLGVTIDGASAITQADLAGLYEPYLARTVSIDDLARIADAVTARYREAGYFLSRAIVPPQDEESSVARIVVIEGRITEVVVEGEGRAHAGVYLRGIDTQPIASLGDLDRRLSLASDVPGLRLHSRIEPDPNDPTSHRLVVTTEFRAVGGYASVDNRGSAEAGPLQAYGRMRANSVLLDRDQIMLGVFTTPSSPSDFTYAEAGYAYTFENGARLAVFASASRSHDGYDISSPEIGADGQSLSLQYDYPLRRGRAGGLWFGAAFDVRHAENDWSGGGGYADELRVARINLRGVLNQQGYASNVFARASFGLDVLGASENSFQRRSRYDADGEFVTFNLHASHYRDLGRYVGVYASVDGQWADRPLLISEEFSIGGQPYGRAYDPGEISGDHGLAGLVELRAGYDPNLAPISFLQGYLFYDTAEAWNYNSAPDADALALSSAGGGLRISFQDWLTARFELARPLTRTFDREHQTDWRQFFSLSAAY